MQQRIAGQLFASSFYFFCSVCLLLSPAQAFDVILDAPTATEGLRDKITGASLVYAAKNDGVSDGQDLVAAAQSDYKRLVGLLYEQGFFGPSVKIRVDGTEAASISPFATVAKVNQIVLSIEPGPRFNFGKTRIAPQATATELPEEFAPGKPAGLSVIQDAARAGVVGWRNQGHAKADVTGQTISADHRKKELNVDLRVEPGPELAFGQLVYSSDSAVREDRVREIADLPSGDRFDPEQTQRVAKRLRRTEAFRSIDLREADTVGPDDTLDINLAVVDDLPRRFGFGAELESTDGLSISGFWLHRNLLGGAENLRLDAEVDSIGAQTGDIGWRLGALYTRPATFHSETDLILGVELKQEDEDLYFLRQASTHIGIKRYFSDRFETSISFNARTSEVDDNFGHREFTIYGIPMTILYDRRDNISNPTSGYYLSASAMPYLGYNDADNAVFLESDLRGYRGFGADNQFIAAGRFQLGSIVGPSLRSTPPDFLFYTGGGGTVRGQPYQSNFVTVNGIDSGGLSFIGLSGEMRVKVTSHISTVAFYDAGFVGETADFTGPGNWHSGAGLGVRYNTGFGPLRIDVGMPVSGSTGDGVQLYIGIGHAF